jgi:transcription elongation factor Elf1
VLRHEFRVKGDIRMGGETVNECTELRLGRNQIVAVCGRMGLSHAVECRGVRTAVGSESDYRESEFRERGSEEQQGDENEDR